MITLGKMLAELRMGRGLRQAEVSRATNGSVAPSTVSRIELGQVKGSVETIEELIKVLKPSPEVRRELRELREATEGEDSAPQGSYKDLRKMLGSLMGKYDISPAYVADHILGLSKQFISQCLHGEKTFSPESFVKIKRTFDQRGAIPEEIRELEAAYLFAAIMSDSAFSWMPHKRRRAVAQAAADELKKGA